MPFRRRFGGRMRGQVRPSKPPKSPKVRVPKFRMLIAAYKRLVSGSSSARVQAMFEAINWWDEAIKAFMTKTPMASAQISTYEKANKARALGLGDGATDGERETALFQCIKMYEKIWATQQVPSIVPYMERLTKSKAELEAKEQALQSKYAEVLGALNAVFGKLGLRYEVKKADIARQFDGIQTIFISQDLCKVLVGKARTEGLLAVLFSEAKQALIAASIEYVADQGHVKNLQRLEQSVPTLFSSVLAYCETVPRTKLFKAAPDSLEAEVGQQAAAKPKQPRVAGTHTQRTRPLGPKVGGRYKPGSAMATLFERLKDGRPVGTNDLFAGLGVANPADRLKWLTRHGQDSGKWTVAIHGNTVQMTVH